MSYHHYNHYSHYLKEGPTPLANLPPSAEVLHRQAHSEHHAGIMKYITEGHNFIPQRQNSVPVTRSTTNPDISQFTTSHGPTPISLVFPTTAAAAMMPKNNLYSQNFHVRSVNPELAHKGDVIPPVKTPFVWNVNAPEFVPRGLPSTHKYYKCYSLF